MSTDAGLIAAWAETLADAGRAALTRRRSVQAARAFTAWFERENHEPFAPARPPPIDLAGYVQQLQRTAKAGTVNVHVCGLRVLRLAGRAVICSCPPDVTNPTYGFPDGARLTIDQMGPLMASVQGSDGASAGRGLYAGGRRAGRCAATATRRAATVARADLRVHELGCDPALVGRADLPARSATSLGRADGSWRHPALDARCHRRRRSA